MAFRPALPFNVSATLLSPFWKEGEGVRVKEFVECREFFMAARSFGGSEKVVNDVLVVEDTMVCDSWFFKEIQSGCRVKINADGSEWEILGGVEDVEMRHQFVRFKIRRLAGDA